MSIEVYRELLGKADADDVKVGRGWYRAAHDRILALASASGYTKEQVAGVVAVLSPMVEWGLNWRSAERVCKSKGKSWRGVPGFASNRRKAKNILGNAQTVTEYVRGPKVRPFYESLLDPTYEEPVIDTQMISFFFKGRAYRDDFKIVSQSEKRLEPIREAVRILAKEKGWTVAEMQGVLWITGKRINGPYADQLKLWR